MRRTTIFALLGFLGLIYGAGSVLGSEDQPRGESWMPHVTYKGQHFVLEEKPFSVYCNLTLFSQLKWTHNGKPIKSGEGGYTMEDIDAPQGYIGSRLSVSNTRMYHAGEYKCTSFSPRSHTVYVFSDDGTAVDAVKMLYLGYDLSITCNLTNMESLGFELKWFKDGIPLDNNDHLKIFPENSSLYIPNPEKADVGEYKCQAETGATDVPLSRIINVIFLEIRKMDKSKVVTEGEDLAIECPVEGHPPPDIQWFKDNIPLEKIEDKIDFLHNEREMPDGQLKVPSIQQNQRGNYTCVITSEHLQFKRSTFVRVKSVYAALWPFIGIVVEMVVLGIIIFIFEKRRAKAEFDESDTDQGNDQ